MDFKIPKTMEKEHEELHVELKKATTAGGATGKSAKRLANVLHPHFVKEEDFVAATWVVASTVERQDNFRHEGYSVND